MLTTGFKIDAGKDFPHLAKSPMIEAVLDIRAQARGDWDKAHVEEELRQALPDYPVVRFQNITKVHLAVGSPVGHEECGWQIQFSAQDRLNIAAFAPGGFSFHRLKPYPGWDVFHSEALRLWNRHLALAQPTEIERIGIRSIDRIDVPADSVQLEDYFSDVPKPPRDMEEMTMEGFLYRQTLTVPDYQITVVRTVQPPSQQGSGIAALIIDIDVATTKHVRTDTDVLTTRLEEMRFLKNTAFFGSLKDEAVEEFR